MGTLAIAIGLFILVGLTLYVGNATMTSRHNSRGGPNADFVGVAEIVPQEPTEKAIPGKLLVNTAGFTFMASPKWNHVRRLTPSEPVYERQIKWSEISSTQLRPHPNKPLPGFVDLALTDGTSVTIRVNLFRRLSQALDQTGHLSPAPRTAR
jgi:hypothetical protein